MSDRHVKNDLGVALVLGGAILLVVIGVAMNGQITPALNAPALTVETFWEWSLYTVKVIAVMVLAGVGLTNLINDTVNGIIYAKKVISDE